MIWMSSPNIHEVSTMIAKLGIKSFLLGLSHKLSNRIEIIKKK